MRRVLSGLASFIIAILVLEILSRTAFTLVADSGKEQSTQKQWYTFSRDLGWARKPGFDDRINGVYRRFDTQGFLAGDSAKFASPLKKVLFLGDSNTFGNDSPADSAYPAIVESLLAGAVSINLATPGYSSYQGRTVLRRALTMFRPDLIVASFNYNDRRYVLDPANEDGPEGFARLYDAANAREFQSAIDRVYLARSVRYVLRKAGLIKTPALLPVRADTLKPRVSLAAYTANLRSIARAGRDAGIPVVFLLLRDGQHQTRNMRDGLAALHRAQPDSAIELFRIQLHYGTEFGSLTRLFLSHTLRQTGHPAEADSVLFIEKPVRLPDGGQPIRLDSEYNDAMRAVAAGEGATVVDGAAILDKQPSVYYDFCHFDAKGHRMVAEALSRVVREMLRL